MSFKDSLKFIQETTDSSLRNFFVQKKLQSKQIDRHTLEVTTVLEDFTLRGGKRIRPFLCWVGYYSISKVKTPRPDRRGGQNSKVKLKSQKFNNSISKDLSLTILALELFQTGTLIHDDIIDKDLQRRGAATMHEHFKLKAESFKLGVRAAHFGESIAILAGDLALAWADELMMQTSLSVWSLYQQMKEETVIGQILDVWKTQANVPIKKEKIDEFKTAYYSIIRPLQIGSTLAVGEKQVLVPFERYGLCVGRAFQLRDDFLDGVVKQEEFFVEVSPLVEKAKRIVSSMKISADCKNLLNEFADFVVLRET